jgi:oligopeptide/dipeptide ABC transporter ATP-binding protein
MFLVAGWLQGLPSALRGAYLATEPEHILQVRNLTTEFHTEKGVVRAVDDISFTVERGKIVGLVGESGCGKSLTALSIMGLVPSPPGRIISNGILLNRQDLTKKNYAEMCKIRGKQIAMIFQEPMTSLNPVYTVGRQVSESLAIHTALAGKQIREKVIRIFELVGIPEPESRLDAYPHQLSGGLRQRVMIAMALICEPNLLIADEPTTALDVTIQAQILNLMLALRQRLDTTIVMITHDLGVIAEMCDDVHVMYAGKIVEKSNVFELFDSPLHPYTRGLLRSVPSIAVNNRQKRMDSIPGMVPNLLQIPSGCRFHPRCDAAMPKCRQQEPPSSAMGSSRQVSCWLYEGKSS